MVQQRRTDLAIEAQELYEERTGGQSAHSGVVAREKIIEGFHLHRVEILNNDGVAAMGKPVGVYYTLTTTPLTTRQEGAFQSGTTLLGKLIGELIAPLSPTDSVLVVGLGNREITPDALGPLVWEHTLVTRHLVAGVLEHFGDMRPVSAISSGVLATTGVESGEIIGALVRDIAPKAVIAVDALASRSVTRLCNTVQIANSGISPGSGVGNHRVALNEETLGVPVIAIGVPTVVDGGTLAADLLKVAEVPELEKSLFVTPRDIDRQVADFAKFIGYGINVALHPSLSLDDLQLLME